MIKAFISGPYRGRNLHERQHNIEIAKELEIRLLQLGLDVRCPHLNTANLDGVVDDGHFLDMYLQWIDDTDIVVALPTWESSSGAKAEIFKARQCGTPVFFLPDDWEKLREFAKTETNSTY